MTHTDLWNFFQMSSLWKLGSEEFIKDLWVAKAIWDGGFPASSLCQTERFPNLKSATLTGTHPQSLITWPYSCRTFLSMELHFFLSGSVIHMRSISGEEDLFHHINAEGFLETKPLHYVVPSDLRPCIVCFSSPSLRHMFVALVCLCIMLAGTDVTDAHYVLWIRTAFLWALLLSLI